jgi:ferredoxin
VLDEISSIDDLPRGWTDRQDAASYRLEKRADEAIFGHVVGPQSWKRFLHLPRKLLGQVRRDGEALRFLDPQPEAAPQWAFIGARACELAAIAIQDKVLQGGENVDSSYRRLRQQIVIIAVNCTGAGGTCFCTSMKTGPRVRDGFDLALTEVIGPERHHFVVEVGTPLGGEILKEVPHREATETERRAAEELVSYAAAHMGRSLDTTDIQDLLFGNFDHPRWEDVARRCLTCGNCTMVCPTCFCTTVEDTTDLAGDQAERWQKWTSCFTLDFSYIHGGSVRPSARARYRQWMTHKLAHWIDQFGTSGCVGCGRCITWCPAAIDITAEVEAIRESTARTTDSVAG